MSRGSELHENVTASPESGHTSERANQVKATGHTDDTSWADVARREVQLLGAGVNGFRQAASDAFSSDNLAWTVGKAALAFGASMAFARLRPVTALGQEALRSFGMSAALGFSIDVAGNASSAAGAMIDAAGPKPNWDRDVHAMEESLGRFGFDTAMMAPFALAGGRLASRGLKSTETAAAATAPAAGETAPLQATAPIAGETAPFRAAAPAIAKRERAEDFDFDSPFDLSMKTYQDLKAKGYPAPKLLGHTDDLVAVTGGILTNPSNSSTRSVLEQLRQGINGVHQKAGIPGMLSLRTFRSRDDLNTSAYHEFGRVSVSSFELDDAINPLSAFSTKAELASSIAHEGEHLEQLSLRLSRNADKLRMGRDKNPLASDIDTLISMDPEGAYLRAEGKSVDPDFVRKVLELRAGNPLTRADARRADLLQRSIQHPFKEIQLKQQLADTESSMGAGFEEEMGAGFDEGMTADEEKHAMRYLRSLQRKLDAIPVYGEWAHEAEAAAVEDAVRQRFLSVYGS